MRARGSAGFYLRWSAFQFRERFTDFGSSLAFLALYPFFVWLLVAMWHRFNAGQGNYSPSEMATYLALTELLFLTFLRSAFLGRAQADFSLALARPRSWLLMTFTGQLGATLGGRAVYAGLALAFLPFLGVPYDEIFPALGRLLLLLPILGAIEAMLSTILSTAQIRWAETRYFTLPLTKIFLALGGVFGSLADYGEPGRRIFLRLLPADLFFQAAHFCVKGQFYGMSARTWTMRTGAWLTAFVVGGMWFYRSSRRAHQSYGG